MVSLGDVLIGAAILATARGAVVMYRDWQRWRHPNGAKSKFGSLDPEQIDRSERGQRTQASMSRKPLSSGNHRA